MTFINPFRKCRCPYCHTWFYPGDCAIVSKINGTVLRPSPLSVASPAPVQAVPAAAPGLQLYGQPTPPPLSGQPAGPAVSAPGPTKSSWLSRLWLESLNKQEFVQELASRQCPNNNCGKLLPYNIESVDNITIAIVGDTFSGKSHW